MGTREVYEEKLRRGNLDYDTTMNPGLGSARCPSCLSLLNPNPVSCQSLFKCFFLVMMVSEKKNSFFCSCHQEKGEWTITSVLHDAAAVAGSGIGGLLSAVHAFNTWIPYLQNRFPGSKRLSFLVGVPLLLGYSGAGAAFGGNMIFFGDLLHFVPKCALSIYPALVIKCMPHCPEIL
ncbi:uncharacterized protein LOC103865917 isoform X1 [Brassica rapa]|uniref:uncharacterized protein LOC103865917 isoform X1 n=1 Tax=Brassica campestris TaxID=3711 RepID=UPI00142E61CD|nr:uncharacterized protein LOC103865917 isoform X1 [Brassica rapa]